MAENDGRCEIPRIIFLCILWYSVSSTNNVIGKMVLNEFPYPMTVTMVQLLSISIYSIPVLKWMGVRKRSEISRPYYKRIILPLAFGKFVSSVFSHVSIWRVPVSYAHTVKATMPLFTVVLARVLFGEKQTTKVYFSLVPIILGVAIATITEISFDMLGLFAALGATCGFSLQNIFSKKVLNDTGLHHLRLLHLLGYLALFMFTPVWMMSEGYIILNDDMLHLNRSAFDTGTLLLLDGFFNWLQNFIAFTILNYVTPLTYAVASATKRISIITVSLLLLRNPITLQNVVGMFLSVVGALGYNKAKYDANQAKKKAALIPLSEVMSGGKYHLNGSAGHLNGTRLPMYNSSYEENHPLTLPQFHPAYAFNHLNRVGPYPRVIEGMSLPNSQNGAIPYNNTGNGYISSNISNNSHTTRSYGRIDSL